MPSYFWLILTVILAPFAAAISAALIGNSRPRWLDWITILSCLLSFILSCVVAGGVIEHPFSFGLIYLDALSIYFILVVNLVALVASWYSVQFLNFDASQNPLSNRAYFHLFFNLFHFTMIAVPMINNLVVMWIFVELTTVFSTMLVRFRRTRIAIEAAWKFIVITTTGIIFALLGTMFMSIAVQIVNPDGAHLMDWSYLAQGSVAKNLDQQFVQLSFLFILIGYGTKAGLAPMHTWLPDGHGEAPSPVSAMLSGVMLKVALYAILRFYTITNINQGSNAFTSSLLIGFGLLSLIFAIPFILKANRFKRVLAYHSLEHMGIIFFGLGLGTQLALIAALLHSLNHAITKALMFLVYGFIQHEYTARHPVALSEPAQAEYITGVLKSMPVAATILGWGGLALVGSPPFNIFMSEFLILWAAITMIVQPVQSIYPLWLLIIMVGIFVSSIIIIFGGLVNHLSRIILGQSTWLPGVEEPPRLHRYLPFFFLMVLILLFGLIIPIWPINFPGLLQGSAAILQLGVHP